MTSPAAPVIRPFNFNGHVVLITGGAGGIGTALVRDALKRGATVALADYSAERLTSVAAELGTPDRVSTHTVDLTDDQAVKQLVQDVLARHGQVNLLINNAGVSLAGNFQSMSIQEFDWVMNINLRAAVVLTHELLPHLKAGDHIVNMSSMAGLLGMPSSSAYSASKFALRGFTESLRFDLLSRQIGVTLVHPGGIKTGLVERLKYADGADEREKKTLVNMSVKSMTNSPEKLAQAVLNAVTKRQPRVVFGNDAKAIDTLARNMPVLGGKLMAQGVKRMQ